MDVPGTRLGEALVFSDTSDEVSLDPVLAVELLYGDVSDQTAAAAVARLRSVHRAVSGGVPTTIAWREVPSTYVICADDRAVHPDLQRAMAVRATQRYEWPGGHCAAVTHPSDIAHLIRSIDSSLSR